ncbi:MAG TPA: complex I NDUFA9 subunit family protein [Burkholderiales bacterium]|nr:complex I NDUFA9 subunit family protein [Burkholderiales bacterium]
MIHRKICILGGGGFVGRRIAARLIDPRYKVVIPTRNYHRHRELTVMPSVRLVEGDVHDPAFLRRTFQGMDAVINLVGILNEKGRSGRGFMHVHAELPAKVIDACHQSGVRRLLQMSALNASTEAPSHYLRSKAAGEDTVHRAGNADFHVTSFQPSVIFGSHDSFTNRFAALLRLAPVFPLACPGVRFQPAFVEDVAQAFVASLDLYKTFGQRYALCGPKVYTLREVVEYLARVMQLRRRIVGLNDLSSRMQAMLLEFFPGKPFSLDNYRSLKVDSVCREGFPPVFGVTPTALEEIVPSYLAPGARARVSRTSSHAG